MNRRALLSSLASGGVAALAGCLDTTNDSSLAVELNRVPKAQLGQPDTVSTDELDADVRAVASDGLGDGTTFTGAQRLDPEEFVVVNGSYYTVAIARAGSGTVARPVLEAEPVSDVDGPVGAWGNLSDSDTTTLRCALSNSERSAVRPCLIPRQNDSTFWPSLQFQYFQHRERTYRLRTTERAVDLDQYEYTFDRVAKNESSFAEYVATERLRIDAATVSGAQRDILRTAATEGVYRESPPPYSEALQSLAEQILAEGFDVTTYVRVDGSYYEAYVLESHDD